MRKCLIISQRESDFSRVLMSCGTGAEICSQQEIIGKNLSDYDSFCILGGTEEQDLYIDARLRNRLETENAKGKRVFCEYVNSFNYIYSAEPEIMTHQRLICAQASDGLAVGDLLDAHCNRYIKPHCMPCGVEPVLVYRGYAGAHSEVRETAEEILENGDWALWRCDKNLIMAAFRLCDFVQARFAPAARWQALVAGLIEWLTDVRPEEFPEPVCTFAPAGGFEAGLESCIEKGISWLNRFVIDNGEGGIFEGLTHHITPDGKQAAVRTVRTDCTGEAGGAFQLHAFLHGDKGIENRGKNLEAFCYENMQIKEGIFKGMIRWTQTAWGVCYQDDVARAILPTLLISRFLKKSPYLGDAVEALEFLASTTARNGNRKSRTDNLYLDETAIKLMKQQPGETPSAHYNAYYHAALLLAWQLTGNNEFLSIAVKGLECLMSVYPETKREQSETEEMCRLIFPLACLFEATRQEKHRDMLYRVANDLRKHLHPFGGYAEWDTGYKAHCSRREKGECSLLAENGDPVADLLYSNNWLPMGFAYAYHATKDPFFRKLWEGIASFMIRTQLHSKNEKLDGAWCRCFDMELREIYGVPHDVGWGPCCAETGWTTGEILIGLQMMRIFELKQS